MTKKGKRGKRSGVRNKSRTNQLKLYSSLNKKQTNKIKKIKRHIKKLPLDLQAQKDLERLTK